MKLKPADIDKIARLSRLKPDEKQKEILLNDLNQALARFVIIDDIEKESEPVEIEAAPHETIDNS